MNEVRKMIRADFEPTGEYGSQLEEQVRCMMGEEIACLLDDVNDKLRPFWYRQWSENWPDRHVSFISLFHVAVSLHSLTCHVVIGFF